MRELLLIRHGQASFSADDYDQLSLIGEQQSSLLGEWLATCSPAPDLVAIGPRNRHRDTAAHCLHAAGVSLSPMPLQGLDEVDHLELLARLRPDLAAPGALRAAMKQTDAPHRAFQRLFVEALDRWSSGAYDTEYSCTWTTFRANALAALKTLADHPSQTTWAFTSGGPIAVIVGALLDVPPSQAFRLSWPLVNTGVTRVRLGSRASTLVTYNAWPHLERTGDAQLVTLR